ncbi:hypothetical protein ONZ45_g13995 [Pleurotus djamor]|nr:hypothetical protein ONZ45_g13995 [Pleurotus djamor]
MGTTQSRHRSVVPSPLSQSTSAVHLQVPEPDHSHIRLPRKLSKRRTPTVDNLFPSEPPPETERNAISLPTTPTEHPVTQDQPANALELSRRTSNLNAPGIPPSSASQISGKKEKRGSVLGRIVKKFSILKGRMGDKQEDSDMHNRNDARKSFVVGGRQASPERPPMEPRRSADPPKRVPPPPLEKGKPPEPPTPPARKSIEKDQHDRASLISVDVPYWGRLTITNPDAPSSGGNTPTQREAPLPPEKYSPPNVHSSPSPPPAPSPATMTLPIEHTPRHDTLSPPSIMPPLSMGESPLLPPIPPLSPAPPPTPDKVDSSRTHTPHERPFSSSLSLPTIPTPAPQGHIPFPISPPLLPDMSIMNASPMTIPSLFDYGDSPLSSLSILANPGTPHNPEMSMPPSVAPPVVPLRPSNEAQASQSSKISRQTETFKLGEGEQWEVVESRKDIEASRDGSRDRPTKSRSKDREREDRDREREREREREKEKERERDRVKEKERERREREAEREREREKERAKEREREKEKERAREKERERDRKERERAKEAEREKEKEREKRKERERERERESSKKEKERDSERDSRREKRRHDKERSKTDSERDRDKPPATRRSSHDAHGSSRHNKTLSLEVNTGSEPSSSRKEESSSRSKRSSDKRDSEKDGRSNRKSSSKDKDKEGSKSRNSSSHKSLERANSSSTRPTSELPSTAELNALRAREAWDMERLWKARSMYGPDPSNMVPAPSSIGTSASYIDPSVASAVHGSSHTAFVIPTPFQQHPQTGHIYHSMPNGPPPIFYAAPHTTQYQHQPQQYPQHYTRAYPIMDPLPPIASRSNPLPEPPRESSYDPAHLAAPILDSHGRPTGKWTNNTKYSGVTTTH